MFSTAVTGLVISLIGMIAVFSCLFYIMFRIFKFMFGHKNIFGDTLQIRLIGLGITALFFSEGVTALLLSPVQFLFGTISNTLNEFRSRSYANANTDDLLTTLGDTAIGAVRECYSAIYYYPIKQVLFAVAFWVLFGQFFSTYKNTGDSTSLFTSLPDYVRKNILRITVFAIGIYLSLAAIIAIPWLNEPSNPENEAKFSQGVLRQSLTKIKRQDFDTLLILPISEAFEAPATRAVQVSNNAKASNELSADLSTFYQNAVNSRKYQVSKWYDSKNKFDFEMSARLNEIITKFESEVVTMKEKQRIKYFQRLREHYQEVIGIATAELGYRKSSILNEDSRLTETILNKQREISAIQTTSDTTTAAQTYYGLPNDFYSDFNGVSVIESSYTQFPAIPAPGDDWGVFMVLGSWLFRTESMSLVLIVGVVGFGLFGASISSFVRDFNTMRTGDAPVKDFNVGEMIIRGISAAVVIFLGVEGGLSVFTMEKMDPNPHVLFFSCLVGAVYSEQIWNWAKDKLEDNFKTDDEETPTEGGTTEEPGNGGTNTGEGNSGEGESEEKK